MDADKQTRMLRKSYYVVVTHVRGSRRSRQADGMGHREQWSLLRDNELIQVISMVSSLLKIKMQQ